jgi:uncharacterized protein
MRWLLCAAVSFWLASPVSALDVPPLKGQVNDLAGMLDPAHAAALESKLETYERATGHQFALLTVPTLDGDVIEDFAVRVFEQWKLGDAKRDDGLLIVVAQQDRKLKIEVGYGLESAVTDLFAGQVLRDVIAPAFREGRAAEGLDRAFDLLMAKAQGIEVGVPRARTRGGSSVSAGFVIFVVIMILIFSRFGGGGGGRRRRGGLLFLPGGFGGGGGWGGGGGGGWGGGGGFGGGGGGSGGGGSSGGW